MTLVLLGAVLGAALGAWAFGATCGCAGRWRWRRQWRAIEARQGGDFTEVPAGHTARFIAQQVDARNQHRARELARRAAEVRR